MKVVERLSVKKKMEEEDYRLTSIDDVILNEQIPPYESTYIVIVGTLKDSRGLECNFSWMIEPKSFDAIYELGILACTKKMEESS